MDQMVPKLETKVTLYKDAATGPLLGFAEIVIAGAFVIKELRIVMAKAKDDKPGGPFVAFPARKGSGKGEGQYFEIAHPITAQARRAVQDCVLRAYAKAAAAQGAAA